VTPRKEASGSCRRSGCRRENGASTVFIRTAGHGSKWGLKGGFRFATDGWEHGKEAAGSCRRRDTGRRENRQKVVFRIWLSLVACDGRGCGKIWRRTQNVGGIPAIVFKRSWGPCWCKANVRCRGALTHWHVKVTIAALHALHALRMLYAVQLVKGQERCVTVRSLMLGKGLDCAIKDNFISCSQEVSFNLSTWCAAACRCEVHLHVQPAPHSASVNLLVWSAINPNM